MDDHGQNGNGEQDFKITLTKEQLGRLTNTNPDELYSQLTQTNEEGNSLSQEEQFNIISNRMSEVFQEVNTHKVGQGKRTAYNEVKQKLHEAFGIERKADFNAMLEELSNSLTNSQNTAKTSTKNPFEDEQVKSKIAQLQQALEARSNEFSTYKTEQEQSMLWSGALNTMISALDAKGALSSSPDIRNNQVKMFSNHIRSMIDLKNENGKVVVYDKNGTPIDDDQSYLPISLEAVAIKNSPFEFNTKTQKPKGFFPDGETNQEKGVHGFTEEELQNALKIAPMIRIKNPKRAAELLDAAKKYRNKNK